MKVVFVLPPYDYSRSVGNTRKKAQIGLLPPLGVGYLAAALEEKGHSAALVDAIAEQLSIEEAVEAVANHAPDVIGISSFTTLSPNDAYPIAQRLRERLPGTPMVMGGPHVTAFGEQIFEDCPEVELLIPGDAELVLCQLVDRLSRQESYEDVPGLIFRGADGEAAKTPPPETVRDIDRLPHPARHIYKNELYEPLPSLSSKRPVTSIITSRGCAWARCRFCYQGGEHGVRYRRRSPENVVDEIKQLVQDYGIRNIVVWDDNFCVGKKWVRDFCDLMIREKLGVVWSVLARADSVSLEMFEHMAKAGCYSVQFGVESGSQEILDMVKKGITLEQVRQAVKWAKKAGMDTRAFFILGFPNETPEMSNQTVRFACELNMDYVVFFSYYVAPGTALAPLAMAEGRCFDYEGQHLPSYLPNTYQSIEQLRDVVVSAYRHYYFRPAYIARALWRACRRPSLFKNHAYGFYYWLGLIVSR